VLGEGGTAVTYQARADSGEPVALKRLPLARLKDWKQLELFEREAKVLRTLDHPGIPRYIDAFQEDSAEPGGGPCFYLAQELFPGRSLKARMAEGWRPGEAEVRSIAKSLLDILVYLQSRHPPVIHRDLKPANVLLADAEPGSESTPDRARRVALVDFGGVVDAYRHAAGEGSTVVGTFGYMAPEQFRAQASMATDLYGLGATLLHVLSGRPPSDLPVKKLKPDVRAAGPLSPDFTAWLDRLLAPDEAERFPSAAAALDALRNPALATRPPAVAVSAGSRLLAGLRHQLSLRALLLLALLVAAGGYLWHKKFSVGGALKGASARELVYLKPRLAIGQHWSAVFEVAFSPDGTSLATAANDGTVKLFSTADGQQLRAYPAHRDRGGAVAFSADGQLLATAADDAVLVFEVQSGTLRKRLIGPRGDITRVAFDPAGLHVAAASLDGHVRAWRLDSGVLVVDVAHGSGDKLLTVAFGPDGKLLFSAGFDRRVEVRHFPGGQLAQSLAGHGGPINQLAVAPDGQTVVTASDDGTLGVWLVSSGKRVLTLRGHSHEVWNVVLDRSGRRAVSASRDGSVRVWDLYRARQLAGIGGDHRGVLGLSLSPDGAELAIGTGSGQIRVLPLRTPRRPPTTAPVQVPYDEDVQERRGWTSLHVAAFEGRVIEVQRLLEQPGTAVDGRNALGRTALYNAAKAGNRAVVKLLIERGANVNAADQDGLAPLYPAVSYGRDEVFADLLAKGADPTRMPDILVIAAARNRVAMLRTLLAKGLSANATDPWDHTAVWQTAHEGHLESLRLLLAQPGIDLQRLSRDGFAPLHVAAKNGHVEIVDLLLAAGADVNQPGPKGWTALTFARALNHVELVILLRERGAR
jgi:ankyrin repeat protein